MGERRDQTEDQSLQGTVCCSVLFTVQLTFRDDSGADVGAREAHGLRCHRVRQVVTRPQEQCLRSPGCGNRPIGEPKQLSRYNYVCSEL